MQGMAIDLSVPDRDLPDLHRAARALRGGGVGYYPKSGFVHVDVGAVRLRLVRRPISKPATPAANSAKSAGSGTDVPPLDPPEDPPPLELDEEDELELEDVDDDEEPPKLLLPPEELLVLEPPWLQPG